MAKKKKKKAAKKSSKKTAKKKAAKKKTAKKATKKKAKKKAAKKKTAKKAAKKSSKKTAKKKTSKKTAKKKSSGGRAKPPKFKGEKTAIQSKIEKLVGLSSSKSLTDKEKKEIAKAYKKGSPLYVSQKNPRRRRRRRNPMSGSSIRFGKVDLGHSAMEAFELAAGGAFYSTVAILASKIPYSDKIRSIPVVGSSLLPILVASAVHGFTKGRSSKIHKAIASVSRGVIAASVVNIGLSAGKMIPGLAGEADFGYPIDAGIPEGLSGADFGGSADFGYPVDAGIPEGLAGADFGDDDYQVY